MREALGLTEARRRRPVPKVDPELVRAVARIGGNLNQIARWLNAAQVQGQVSAIDAITVATRLVAIERALSETRKPDGAPVIMSPLPAPAPERACPSSFPPSSTMTDRSRSSTSRVKTSP
nr:MobC family plasmid mobilization relaxosome protein [Agrobacterium tumefaciens]